VTSSLNTALLTASAFAGASLALLLVALLVWTWRDASARTRSPLLRVAALVLVLLFNLVGLVVYLLLRPRETLAEYRERQLIEELLAREVTALGGRGRAGAAGS
jgi:hypothetical protein